MSATMRVDERSLTEQTNASRTGESQRIQLDTATSSSAPQAATADHVDLTSLTGRITQAMQTLSSQAAQRVSQLQGAVRAGRYQPDARQISHAMVNAHG